MLKIALSLFIVIGFASYTIIEEKKPKVVYTGHNSSITGTVSGTVTIPDQPRSRQRISRGRAYRNRGTSAATTGTGDKKTAFFNTIISAHPLSYNVDVEPIAEPVQIIQENAEFKPHVTPVTIGSTVEFVNNDAFFHNVYSLTRGAKFNIGRRPKGDVFSQKIPATKWKVEGIGPINLLCDIHSQMNAKIVSLDTPYYTRANEDGTYSLENLPDGTYEIRAYNPNFDDVASQTITISGNSATVALSF